MAIKIQGQTVVDDNRKGSFQVTNPGSFTTAQRNALSAVAGDQIFNTDTNKLEIYNGSQWESAGGASTSPPNINNVVLSEDSAGGSRFTSESFTAAITMVDDGTPVSQKGVKGKVTSQFAQFPSTTPITVNTNTSYNGGSTNLVTSPQTSNNSVRIPVNEDGRSGYLSVYNYYNSSSSPNDFYFNSSISSYFGTAGSSIGSVTPNSNPTNLEIIPPSSNNDGVTLYVLWANNSRVVAYWNSSGTFTVTRHGLFGPMVRDMDTNNGYYFYCSGSSQTNMTVTRVDKYPGTNDTYISRNIKQYTSAYDVQSQIAVGNGKVIGSLRSSSSNNYRPKIWVLSTTFGNNAIPSSYNFNASSNRTIEWMKFHAGYFWVLDSGSLYRSSTGESGSWTLLNTTYNGNSYQIKDIKTDPISGNLVGLFTYGGNSSIMLKTNNFGSTWTLYASLSYDDYKYFYYGNNRLIISRPIRSGSAPSRFRWVKLREQSITVTSTGGDYSQFNVGDLIKPSTSYDSQDQGTIEAISGTTFTVDSQYLYQVGDVIEAINTTGTATSTRFLVVNVTGAVTGTQSSDPGYTQLGPGTTQQITFPATFSSGNAPDVDLPAGTTLQVEVEATNSSASDTYPSNIITPS